MPLFDIVGDLVAIFRDMQHTIRRQPMGCRSILLGDDRIARLEQLPELGNHRGGLGKIDVPAWRARDQKVSIFPHYSFYQ